MSNDPDQPTGNERDVLGEAVEDLAQAVEHHETRLSQLETAPAHSGNAANDQETPQNSEEGGDRRVRVRRRGPLRRRRRVAGRTNPRGTAAASWYAEDWAEFAAWVEWLRSHELDDHIPSDWDQIPLVVSELRALRWAWLSCERSTHPSFEPVYWHDALGRALSRIEEQTATHRRQHGLSTLATTVR